MTWPIDKLAIINDVLALTGNRIVTVVDDGSPEWTVASAAYEAAISYMVEQHDWKFASLVAVLPLSATPPSDPLFTNAYSKPADLLHLVWVRLNDQNVVYQILNNQIVMNAAGQPPVTPDTVPGVVTIKYIRQPTPDQVTPTFAMALRSFVMSGIYRGLNEDVGNAEHMWQGGETFLAKARTRSDQEAPKRAMFNSRMNAARRIRRPWPPVPAGWNGTGNPG